MFYIACFQLWVASVHHPDSWLHCITLIRSIFLLFTRNALDSEHCVITLVIWYCLSSAISHFHVKVNYIGHIYELCFQTPLNVIYFLKCTRGCCFVSDPQLGWWWIKSSSQSLPTLKTFCWLFFFSYSVV